jgi:ApaG protein
LRVRTVIATTAPNLFTYAWNRRQFAYDRGEAASELRPDDRIGIGASTMYRAVTRSIEVVVKPRFVADKSSPENNYFFWAYTISITNKSAETVQLKTRHWRITDANGRRQEVRGAGVVGEEPVLKAGEQFEYTSGVPLQTPSGFMAGSYGMVSSAGEHFDIEVPAFSLDSVETKRTLN